MKKFIAILLALCCVLPLVACGGGGNTGTGGGGDAPVYNVEGENKTTIEFFNFNGGVGSVWLEKAAEEFAKINSEKSFGGNHKGVYVHITKDMAVDVDGMASSGYHIYTEEIRAFPNDLAARGLVYNLDDVVKDTTREGGSLESLIYENGKGALMSDGHYYGLPHYESYGTISYDYKKFDQYKFFLTDDATKGEKFGNCYFTDGNGTLGAKSKGPDGVADTEDDGLPVSLEQFITVMERIYNSGKVMPMVLSGKHTNYSTYLAAGLWASLAGKEQMTNYYNCSGPVEVCKRDASGNVLLTDEPLFDGYDYVKKPQTETIVLDATNGYRGNDMVAKYYAYGLIEIMLHEGWFAKETKNPNADHYFAQIAFLAGKPTYDNSAMLLDATYWYNEAKEKNSFKFVTGGEAATDVRVFSLPTNYYTEGAVGKPTSFIDISHCYLFVNKKIEGNAEIENAVKEFVKFLYSDTWLKNFTIETGMPRAINYTLSAEEIAKMPTFYQNLWKSRKTDGSNVIYCAGNTAAFEKHRTSLQIDLFAQGFDADGKNPYLFINKLKTAEAFNKSKLDDWN